MTPAVRLRIETFGHFAVRYGDREVALNGRKARALLGYLALGGSLPGRRASGLVGLLWSETEEAKARCLPCGRRSMRFREASSRGSGFDKFDADKHINQNRPRMRLRCRPVGEGDDRRQVGRAARNSAGGASVRPQACSAELEAVVSIVQRLGCWAKRQCRCRPPRSSHLEDALRRQTDAASGHNEGARSLVPS